MKDNADNNHPKQEIVSDNLVPIAAFNGREEAYLSRGKLQSEGIVSFVIGDHLLGAMGTSVIQLQVKESDVVAAERILNFSRIKCPVCQSIDIGDNLSLAQKFLSYVPFTNLLSSFRKNRASKCKKCGYEWKTEQSEH